MGLDYRIYTEPEKQSLGGHKQNLVQLGGLVSRGSVAEYQADERAVVARLRWRVSGR